MAGQRDTEPTQAATFLHRTKPCSRETPNPLDTASADRNVLEYCWKAAWSFFDKGERAAEEWVADQARKILHGNARQVAAGIRRRATAYGYAGPERTGADEAARYLENKQQYLDYATALKKGWPIATGIIEGACRHIVRTEWT